MKIAIMTWYKYKNYGSKLQAAALKTILEIKKNEVDFINYNPKGQIKTEPSVYNSFRILSSKMKARLFDKIIKNDLFDKFSNKYFKETELCDSFFDLYKLNDKYDCFICGSDQIWSPNNYDSKYFLDFAQKNKIISYAPSIGLNKIDNLIIKENMSKLISRFDNLSIREETGANIIKQICNRDAQVVLDPTLLMTSDDWEKYENLDFNKIYKNKRYIVTYFLGKSNKYINEIKTYASSNNCEIINIPVYQRRKINKYNLKESIGPSEFLSLLKNAFCVFTDSFHGIIFSINYNVNFYAFKRFKSKDRINQNSRVLDILTRLNLTDRVVSDDGKFILTSIDYTSVNEKLKELRKNSNDFLDNSLHNVEANKESVNEKIFKCFGCGACSAICPHHALNEYVDEVGFIRFKVDKKKCTSCNLCHKVCPLYNTNTNDISSYKRIISFSLKDKLLLSESSSGGASAAIVNYLNSRKNYYVSGCYYDNDKGRAEHILIEPNRPEIVNSIKGSKYLQSSVNKAFLKIMNLKKDEKLVFIGTPCQVAGLANILELKNIRDNYILIDLICHGVPSANLWNKYVNEILEKYPILKDNHKIIIRNGKLTKSKKSVITFSDIDGNIIYKNNQDKDLFYFFFNDGTCYNETCFDCPFRTKSSADIRLGDYWGDKFKNNNTGVSMVTIFTERGQKLIQELEETNIAYINNGDINDYYIYQYPYNKLIPLYRDDMLADFSKKETKLKQLRKKYNSGQLFIAKLYKIKNLIRKKK